MKKIIVGLSILVTLFVIAQGSIGQVGDKDDPMPKEDKPAFGDKEELVLQNRRLLKVRNETATTLNIYVQFRAFKNDAWAWVPGDPAKSGESMSFELAAGAEREVQYEAEPVSASRIRVAATSMTHKWLSHTRKDLWLVPERNEDGEHVYLAEAVETFTVAIARTVDKEVAPFESPSAGERIYPTEGMQIPPPPEEIPWDAPPPEVPLIQDLAVLPAQVMGANVVLRVQNLGHANPNMERHLVLKRIVPGSVPVEIGHVGHLFHLGVRTYFLVSLKPGNYRAFLNPGDGAPYGGNDARLFTIAATGFTDLAVLPVKVVGKKVHIKLKNIGTKAALGGMQLKVMKLPGGPPMDYGLVAPLPPNATQVIPSFDLLPGNYRAFLAPGDQAPFKGNDFKLFNVAAVGFVDLDVLPVTVLAGKATVKVKNIGTVLSPAAGPKVIIKKLPMGPTKDLGPIGGLAPNGIKVFAPVPLPAGNYRAYLDPGDPLPYKANDFDDFGVGAAPADLSAGNLAKAALKVQGSIKNNGPGKYNAGPRQWHIEKKTGPIWMAVPTVGSHVIPDLPSGATHPIQGGFVGPGLYRIRISPPDAVPGNDINPQMLP